MILPSAGSDIWWSDCPRLFFYTISLGPVQVHSKTEKKKHRNTTYVPSNSPYIASSLIHIPHYKGSFAANREPTFPCHCHPWSTLQSEIHSCYLFVERYGQIHGDMYPPFFYHMAWFYYLKDLLCSVSSDFLMDQFISDMRQW